jgi:hypothetical protein
VLHLLVHVLVHDLVHVLVRVSRGAGVAPKPGGAELTNPLLSSPTHY